MVYFEQKIKIFTLENNIISKNTVICIKNSVKLIPESVSQ